MHYWQEKAQFGNIVEYQAAATPDVPASQAIARANVIDLTAKMGKDGTLNWDVPAGTWAVLRMGYSLTGQTNSPASPEATGYEVDKLDRQAVDGIIDHYIRSAGKRDAAIWARGSWGTGPAGCGAGNRASAGRRSAAWNVVV